MRAEEVIAKAFRDEMNKISRKKFRPMTRSQIKRMHKTMDPEKVKALLGKAKAMDAKKATQSSATIAPPKPADIVPPVKPVKVPSASSGAMKTEF